MKKVFSNAPKKPGDFVRHLISKSVLTYEFETLTFLTLKDEGYSMLCKVEDSVTITSLQSSRLKPHSKSSTQHTAQPNSNGLSKGFISPSAAYYSFRHQLSSFIVLKRLVLGHDTVLNLQKRSPKTFSKIVNP